MTNSNEALIFHTVNLGRLPKHKNSPGQPGFHDVPLGLWWFFFFQEGDNLRTKKVKHEMWKLKFSFTSPESQQEALGWQRNSSSKSLARGWQEHKRLSRRPLIPKQWVVMGLQIEFERQRNGALNPVVSGEPSPGRAPRLGLTCHHSRC